jgi:hypothetical protein
MTSTNSLSSVAKRLGRSVAKSADEFAGKSAERSAAQSASNSRILMSCIFAHAPHDTDAKIHFSRRGSCRRERPENESRSLDRQRWRCRG